MYVKPAQEWHALEAGTLKKHASIACYENRTVEEAYIDSSGLSRLVVCPCGTYIWGKIFLQKNRGCRSMSKHCNQPFLLLRPRLALHLRPKVINMHACGPNFTLTDLHCVRSKTFEDAEVKTSFTLCYKLNASMPSFIVGD